jgi:hypothetical protein
MNKKAIIKNWKEVTLMGILILILIFMILPQISSAGTKENQFIKGNFTCENITDIGVNWAAMGTKGTLGETYFNWSMETDSPGQKDKDVVSIYSYARYMSLGSRNAVTTDQMYVQIANKTDSPVPSNPGNWSLGNQRVVANLNTSLAPDYLQGPYWECGIAGTSPNTCEIAGGGFNNFSKIYSVFARAEGGGPQAFGVTDVFNVRYTWCWTPLIHDADVSIETGTWEETFTFYINVTNPGANTTVTFWRRKVPGTWAPYGGNQSCANCTSVQEPYNGALSWAISNFNSGDVGNWEFKFTAIDDAGYTANASADSTTNECLDSGNDCKFAVTVTGEAATGVPLLLNETVNNQVSATEGWGYNWTFSTHVNHTEDGVGEINLTLYLNTTGDFVNWGTKLCDSPCTDSTKYYWHINNFSCTDISSAQYRFSATSINGTTNETNPFTIQRNDIVVEYVYGNNSIANRSGIQMDTLILRINDTDNRTYVGSGLNITFYVTKDSGTDWDSGTINQTNSSGFATYYFNPICAPKYYVGDQDWYGEVGSSETCYKTATSSTMNLSIKGDIALEITKPDGTRNFTQEDIVDFLGATTDDCGDSLTASVAYNASLPGSFFICDNNTQVGANAFTCDFTTNITTTEGWYNVTMSANASNHYDNFTTVAGIPSLFYLNPVKKLEYPTGLPVADGWGHPNWNFTVTASSGDVNNVYNISIYMGQSVNPNECSNTTCINQTPMNCTNCILTNISWVRNFTYEQQGAWFYQFKMDDADDTKTSGTEKYITVLEDETNITYGGIGDDSNVTRNSTSTILAVRVYDVDRGTYELNPSATVTFKLRHVFYDGNEKIIGSNITNASGYALLNFSFANCSGWQDGDQSWSAEINSTDSNYNISTSANFTIELIKSGCNTTVEVTEVLTPSQVFQYKNFSVNATVTAWKNDATNVTVILNSTQTSWIIYNQSQYLGTVGQGAYDNVFWIVNATTTGSFALSGFANSTNGGNDTLSSTNLILQFTKN